MDLDFDLDNDDRPENVDDEEPESCFFASRSGGIGNGGGGGWKDVPVDLVPDAERDLGARLKESCLAGGSTLAETFVSFCSCSGAGSCALLDCGSAKF